MEGKRVDLPPRPWSPNVSPQAFLNNPRQHIPVLEQTYYPLLQRGDLEGLRIAQGIRPDDDIRQRYLLQLIQALDSPTRYEETSPESVRAAVLRGLGVE